VARIKAGETLVVSGAAGHVGSLVCQIGKIYGAKVIGIAGTDDKCRWLTDELKIDAAINYKSPSFREEFKKTVGLLDVFFDNVGGEILDLALSRLKQGARITLCGELPMPKVTQKMTSYTNKWDVRQALFLTTVRGSVLAMVGWEVLIYGYPTRRSQAKGDFKLHEPHSTASEDRRLCRVCFQCDRSSLCFSEGLSCIAILFLQSRLFCAIPRGLERNR
jgi:Zinc-binding dehydrogenase